MKFNLTIGRRLALGFGIIILLITSSSWYTYESLRKNRKLNAQNSKVYTPSISKLKDLKILVSNLYTTMNVWLVDGHVEDLNAIRDLHSKYNDKFKSFIEEKAKSWDEALKENCDEIFLGIEEVLEWQNLVLNKFAVRDEEDVEQVLELDDLKKDKNDFTKLITEVNMRINRKTTISNNLEKLIDKLQATADMLSDQMNNSSELLQQVILIIGIALLIFGISIALFTYRSIVNPINNLKEVLLTMGQGSLPRDKIPEGNDEIGEMSAALNNLISSLKDTSDFSKKIGEGQFGSEYQPLSEDDVLGNSLLLMRDNLAKVAEEDKKRSWATEGLAQFGEILRKNNNDLTDLTQSLIFELVKYLKANQGAVFVINKEAGEEIMKVAACYAWDRYKYLDQKIEKGDGLVGQAWQEQSTFYLTDVPENYINITSGLGAASPKAILIVPMIVNEEMFGVIELASFHEMEPYQIEFVERLAENTAATISTVKVNERTKVLLAQAQEASEQLRSQEEELRQNQEEMMATQEEMQRNLDEAHDEIKKLKKKN